ncbi:hypothetical protein OUZ56_033821 [Daphnia magna]|uniref:Uncharacterized protein n=1 Tax=Daphnia magna TaxID=35525 RepID=A0ABR0BB69_9CRUS|nr:hypothetical protein OUZ56_033821 [Daphnia magna]
MSSERALLPFCLPMKGSRVCLDRDQLSGASHWIAKNRACDLNLMNFQDSVIEPKALLKAFTPEGSSHQAIIQISQYRRRRTVKEGTNLPASHHHHVIETSPRAILLRLSRMSATPIKRRDPDTASLHWTLTPTTCAQCIV